MKTPRREELEDFVYAEAALLDAWKLEEWLELLTEDFTYHVPATDAPDAPPGTSMSLVHDDRQRIAARVKQLLGKTAWAENPKARTRRMLSNLRIIGVDGERVELSVNFVVFRCSVHEEDRYVGRYHYELVKAGESWKIRTRRALLDNFSLGAQGKVSIIL